jgi:acyl carrier protein
MVAMSSVKTIRDVILNDIGWAGNPRLLTDDYPLIENEVIDSLGIQQLVLEIEARCGLFIEPEDLVPQNFETLAAIAALVDRKLAS